MRGLVLALALGALLAAGCGGGEERAMPQTTAAPATEPAPGTNRPPAPPIAGTTLSGDRVSLADYAGRAVLINVWSSW